MQINHKLSLTLERNSFFLIILALLFLIYAPLIFHWYDGWLNKNIGIEHEYFSHGIIGIPFAIYIGWNNRKKWQRLPNQSHPLGAILLIIGSIFYLTGVAEFVNLSLPIILTGLCLWLKGIAGFKLNSFALLLIALATPNSFPYLITPFTLPLQKFIAAFAGFLLIQLGMDVTVEQIYLAVGGRLVEVAPYCAGLKMLFTSLYVGLMLLYWTGNLENRKKTTLLLVGAAFISISANIIRNTILTFFHGTGRDELFTWFHDSWGGDVYSALMLASVVLLLNFLDQLESLKNQ
ncbi:MAG: cyanoexosortase B [Stanieria sp.]